MRKFINRDFMLHGDTASRLYHEYAEHLPIIDYHCHINPREIYEDTEYDNITQLWLYGDHYKWRAMRTCGIDEKYITGSASDYDKFYAYAKTLEMAIGNPLYHWSHMELKKYFNCEKILNTETAPEIWEECNRVLQNGLSVRKIIEMSNVETICTTDDPIDDLIWHRKISADASMKTKVLPAWRPDKLLNISRDEFCGYIKKLSEVSGIDITDISSLKRASRIRLSFFEENGCKVCDHGLDYVPYLACGEEEADRILKLAMSGEMLNSKDVEKYQTFMLCFLTEEYRKRDWVLQLHYGCVRNLNARMYQRLGADSGYDAISGYAPSDKLIAFLNHMDTHNSLPKTILYSLNPNDNAIIDSIIGAFQGETAGKIQHGSAWWFNDNKEGMLQQMTSLANLGILGNFIGMLTDSRSFLSYTRHDYFRRILCDMIGMWVEKGEYPPKFNTLEKIITGIAYGNAKKYFNL